MNVVCMNGFVVGGTRFHSTVVQKGFWLLDGFGEGFV